MAEKRKDSKGRVLRTGESERADGRYQYRYTQGTKRHTIYASTLKELREKEDEVLKARQENRDYARGEITVGELLDQFLDSKRYVNKNTYTNYMSYIKSIKVHQISYMKIRDVTIRDASQFALELSECYTMSTIHNIWGVLRQAFQIPFCDDVVTKNPFSLPASKWLTLEDDSKTKILTIQEEQLFLSALVTMYHGNLPVYQLSVFLLHTGLRIGECFGLTWNDVDFEKKIITVSKQLTRHISIETPKSKSGIRIVPLDDVALQTLKEMKESYPPIDYEVDGYTGFIFHSKTGDIKRTVLYNLYNRVVDKYNKSSDIQLPHIHPHMFRHTFCSRLVERKISPKALQYIMGHANTDITLNTYAHTSSQWAEHEFRTALLTTPNLTPNLTPIPKQLM